VTGIARDILIADAYSPEIVARLARETGALVPIEWDPQGRPQGYHLTVRICAFIGCLHVNAYDGGGFMGPDLLPLTPEGMGQSVQFGPRRPSDGAGWVDDIWPALLEVVTRAVRLVEAHAAENVCEARIGYTKFSEDPIRTAIVDRFPYRCQLAAHSEDQPHQYSRFRWVGSTPPIDGNGPMACAPIEAAGEVSR
jgi:hypothetical protein